MRSEAYFCDCLNGMLDIADSSIDLMFTDMPYGVLNKSNDGAKWDEIIPLEPWWEQANRIVKPNGAVVLFAQGMFTAHLMMSNPNNWRYNLVWKKGNRITGFLDCADKPLRNHEDICVFYRAQPTYNPQMTKGPKNHPWGKLENQKPTNNCYGKFERANFIESDLKYPQSILDFDEDWPKTFPTQKPIALCRYIIRTYSSEGDTVCDTCLGSGTLRIAAYEENRNFIGYEKDDACFKLQEERFIKHTAQMSLFVKLE